MNTPHKLEYIKVRDCSHKVSASLVTGQWSTRRCNDEVTLSVEMVLFREATWVDEDEVTDFIFGSIENSCGVDHEDC